jgi:hypothetical protein
VTLGGGPPCVATIKIFQRQFFLSSRQQVGKVFTAVPQKVWWLKWVVDVASVGSGEAALKHLANYLCQPPLREHQLERVAAQGVTHYKRRGT